MSETSSSLAEWAQLYQHGFGAHPAATPAVSGSVSAVADSMVVSTTSNQVTAGSSSSPAASHPAIEGRVGKSSRRRSRASRRAPTTLLNTDTTNFRAMVQQFTGIPSATYSSNYQPGNEPMTSFGLSFNDPTRQAATVVPFGHLQHQFQGQTFQHQHQGLQQQQQQHQQIYDGNMFTVGNHENNDGVFLQGFSNPRANLEGTDGFFVESISGQMMPRPASTDNRTHGFFS